jgi:hypothetical protein
LVLDAIGKLDLTVLGHHDGKAGCTAGGGKAFDAFERLDALRIIGHTVLHLDRDVILLVVEEHDLARFLAEARLLLNRLLLFNGNRWLATGIGSSLRKVSRRVAFKSLRLSYSRNYR